MPPPRTEPGAGRRRPPSGEPTPERSPGGRPQWPDGDPGDAGPGRGGPASGADLHTRARRRLARRDQRYTPGRRALVTALAAARRPVAVADLLVVERSLAASSAYRNLGVLQEAGVVRRVPGTDDHDRFELSEELSGHHHHHVVCSDCGAMVDVTPAPRLEQVLAQAVGLAEEETGFAVDEHRIELVGRCRSCQGRRHPAEGHRADQ